MILNIFTKVRDNFLELSKEETSDNKAYEEQSEEVSEVFTEESLMKLMSKIFNHNCSESFQPLIELYDDLVACRTMHLFNKVNPQAEMNDSHLGQLFHGSKELSSYYKDLRMIFVLAEKLFVFFHSTRMIPKEWDFSPGKTL